MNRIKQGGFTLIELIMVITLLAILSYSASGLFSSSNNFSALAAKNQFLAAFLLAQQQALANQDNNRLISLRVQQNSDEWLLDICRGNRTGNLCQAPATTIFEQRIERDTVLLKMNNANFSGSHIFNLDINANLNPRTIHYRFDFIADSTHTICLSTAAVAFANVGLCPWE